ncbi:transcription repressor NadR [Clostridium estertheticum]|uniref:transcription repressor NadR n=1 Tax=Clostridium estertheticum TaxID=238834 RepID=UPI001CF3D1B2|nr:transcription repressor NadR [Clostridium estertheticum]MCB2356827.1 transcription repressor NadR [Clostridium estertheticum]WAG41252.1 transcription repressor NadR [Clostridium estertheticum]
MNSKERREYIRNLLVTKDNTYKGQFLAEKLGVTRQVIVKDIAIIRAEGVNIIATPEGYLIPSEENNFVRRVIAVSHGRNDIYNELECIVKFGGVVEDVTVEHPLYGEIRAMIMIKTLMDIEGFAKKFKESSVQPLSYLTKGIHLHTIKADNEEIIESIIKELKEKNYLISD